MENRPIPPLMQEFKRDLTDAYFSGMAHHDYRELNHIAKLLVIINTESRKLINSGPDEKRFYDFMKKEERITWPKWQHMRTGEHTGKGDFRIDENEEYHRIVDKVEKRASAYKPVEFVYYLNNTDSAIGFGHAAILLVNSEGNGTFYSYEADMSVNVLVGDDVPARLGKLYMTAATIKEFMKTGKISGIRDAKGHDYNGNGTDHYSGYIKMPVTDPLTGIYMIEQAEEIYKKPGLYNLFQNNCNHIVQQILARGGMNFTPTRGSSLDEQKTMLEVLVGENKISAVIGQVIRDVLDFTIPNSAFVLGNLIALGNNWEAGTIP